MQETQVQFQGQEDPLEKRVATQSSILAWRIPETKEPGRIQSVGLPRLSMRLLGWVTHTHNVCNYLKFLCWSKTLSYQNLFPHFVQIILGAHFIFLTRRTCFFNVLICIICLVLLSYHFFCYIISLSLSTLGSGLMKLLTGDVLSVLGWAIGNCWYSTIFDGCLRGFNSVNPML